MRLCRFELDEVELAGFYEDGHVIPIVQAAETYCEEVGVELLLSTTDDLLDFLPPDGPSRLAIEALYDWTRTLDSDQLGELALPIDQVKLLVPIPRPPKILLLAGNYAAHVIERGRRRRRAGRDVPLRLHEAADDHPHPPWRPRRDSSLSRPTTSITRPSWAS